MRFCNINQTPDSVSILTESAKKTVLVENGTVKSDDISIDFRFNDGVTVFLTAKDTPLKKIFLRWNGKLEGNVKILGDAFERGYGNLEWRGIVPERPMYWYTLVNENEQTVCYGVKVRPSAFAIWNIDNDGVTLILDVCNGSHGVILGGRTVELCTVITEKYEDLSAYDAGVAFCKLMCTDGVFPKEKVYGYNNWYYAYGNSSQEELLCDADYLAELTKGLTPRPYFVIDDCWEKNVRGTAGPWDELADGFTDMKALAEAIKSKGLKTGIWLRPLHYTKMQFPKEWVLHDYGEDFWVFDITVPEAREYVLENFRRVVQWGYDLIKHDFTTFDLFYRRFIKEPTDELVIRDFHFADRSKTNAEIICEFYKDIKKASGDALIIGCNTVSHLAAGIFEIQRTGDDTSGKEWDRTRKMGINTLAFRMMQHNVFYAVDADCVGITKDVPWEKNKLWLEILSKSGTPLFVSTKKGVANEEQIDVIKEAFRINSKQDNICVPLNWQSTVCPDCWDIDGEIVRLDLF